jgi:phosphatidylglycerol:prolipoprotein diacylglycerol transferase
MLPILHIGPLALPVPQFSYLLAFWFGLSLAEKFAPRRGIAVDALYNLIFTGLITGVVAGRMTYVFQYPTAFIQSPVSLISLNPGLINFFSGSAFAVIGMLIYGQRAKLKLLDTLDALTPLLAMMAVGMAVAHIASGEAFGSETSLPWAINLWGANRHPTQFYELAMAIIILGLSGKWSKSITTTGKLFLGFIALSDGSRLFLEGFRGDSSSILNGLRTVQIIAWVVLAASLGGLDVLNRKPNDKGKGLG